MEAKTIKTPRSSWIREITYLPTPDGAAYLAVWKRDGEAMLYGGPNTPVPEWMPRLVKAACGGRSVGHAFGKLLRGKSYDYQRITGPAVAALWKMLKGEK